MGRSSLRPKEVQEPTGPPGIEGSPKAQKPSVAPVQKGSPLELWARRQASGPVAVLWVPCPQGRGHWAVGSGQGEQFLEPWCA